MKYLVSLALLVALVCCGGAPAKAPSPSIAREEARNATLVLSEAWKLGADACIDLSVAGKVQLKACEDVFMPARAVILSAADLVDSWDAAAANKFPCIVKAAAAGLRQGLLLAQLKGTENKVIDTALAMADTYGRGCQ